MGTPFLGELKLVAFNFAPKSWALCNGQLLPINQNQALFSILGTTYGGNGQTNFALPDLRSRVAIHPGSGFVLGQKGGEEFHTLTQAEMPQHFHQLQGYNGPATSGAAATTPVGNSFASAFAVQPGGAQAAVTMYSNAAPDQLMNPAGVTNVGGSQAHENRQPYTVLVWCIALQGIFPSRN